ncbi:hypothetical protein [Methylobacterium oxalidis]|uniref:Methyltransferase n=1 Tax=Methylobacterium oxalidis TaxID=944322 RepID=A0A512J3Q6_9HYPH|nr:hypothetical protein [Methylobacterium oxalidis]GEP04570.1 hypothetical protein MOX02_26080 [Methylobacterium oxalidis]GJE35667.1 hypothetical protein LDDCCGHA_5887 [Methylobacterium oxalidis]GLS62742.1 hypothetical protein GCM10007888_11230 [Methylobacterium oxalidis]
MLRAWALYLTNPAHPALRRLGYLRESVSLYYRSRRCRAAWHSHLEASRGVILNAVEQLPKRRTVIVLGSGLLDDIPLSALASGFSRVVLVDAIHLWPVRIAVRRYPNVERVTLDISGTAGMLLGSASAPDDTIGSLCAEENVDLVVSANLLSQLPILPLDWFEERGLPVPSHLARNLIRSHLDVLTRMEARVCLITDTVEIELDRNGSETDRLDLMHGVALPKPDKTWDWDLAPFGEAAPDHRLLHRVEAYSDWHEAVRG